MFYQLQIYFEETGWADVFQNPDTPIEIEENSPVWDTNATTFSYSFGIPIEQNRHIFGNVDNIHGEDIYSRLYNRRFRLFVGGILFRSGLVHLDDQIEITDNEVEIELVANYQELSEMLDGINCQDVDISGDEIQIGVAFPQKLGVQFRGTEKGYKSTGGARGQMVYSREWQKYADFYMPRIVVPHYYRHDRDTNGKDFTNTHYAYNPSAPASHPYCNVRVCSQKYEIKADAKGEKDWEKVHGYSIGEPDRVNSAPCFFVMYFLHKLFELKGIPVTENAMEHYEDMKRLAFFHTNCEYDEVRYTQQEIEEEVNQGETPASSLIFRRNDPRNKVTMEWDARATGDTRVFPTEARQDEVEIIDYSCSSDLYSIDHSFSGIRCHAYANSKNFPDKDVVEVINSLEAAFGLRFMFDSNGQTLRIVCVDEILAQNEAQELNCHVNSVVKQENHTLGYRLKYSSSNEIPTNKITGAKERAVDDDETSYNYWDDRDAVTFPDVESGIDGYEALTARISPYDTTYYVDLTTGNGYRIKVNSEADSDETQLYPSLFQVGGFRDAEYGDCSNNDFVKETSIGFLPVIENDTNGETRKNSSNTESDTVIAPKLAQYVDVEIHHNDDDSLIETAEVFKKSIFQEQSRKKWGSSKIVQKTFWIEFTFKMKAVESYEIASGGENPYDTLTPEFRLGIMRGSGGGGGYTEYDQNYDGEGNYKWIFTTGTDAAFTSDSVDQYGSSYDYNSDSPGYSDNPNNTLDKRISLKLKAEKPIRGDVANGYYPVNGTYCAKRGLFDKFHARLAYWEVNGDIAVFQVDMELADLLNFDFTKKYNILNYKGFVKKIRYTITSTGLSGTEVHLLYI